MRRDIDHLNALAICHFVYAGLAMLAVLAGAFYLLVGFIILTAPPPPPAAGPPPPFPFLGGMLMLMGGGLATVSLAGAILTLIAGLDLRKQRRWTFSFVMAIINAALGFPIGTALGVFTIIVLLRPSVKALYAGEAYVAEGTAFRPGEWDDRAGRARPAPDDDRFLTR